MIAIIDYGVGNLYSLLSSLKFIGEDAIVTGDKDEIARADKLILPGVGAFSDAMKKLTDSGISDIIKEQADLGKDIMGICLGMQLLFEKSYEYGEHEGLSLLKGNIVPLEGYVDKSLKIPHIGWNALKFERESKLFKYISEGDYVYFVHSYYAADCSDSIIASAFYDKSVTAAVQKDNIYGCQFHPEKSGKVGLNILRAFCER